MDLRRLINGYTQQLQCQQLRAAFIAVSQLPLLVFWASGLRTRVMGPWHETRQRQPK